MAGSIVHKNTIEVTYNSGRSEVITLNKTVSSISEARVQEIEIAASATITLWDSAAASENITDFDYLFIANKGTNTFEIELVIDDNDGIGEELQTHVIPVDASFVLYSKSAYANHSAGDAFGGTLDTIERIRVKEPNAVAGNILFIIGS